MYVCLHYQLNENTEKGIKKKRIEMKRIGVYFVSQIHA